MGGGLDRNSDFQFPAQMGKSPPEIWQIASREGSPCIAVFMTWVQMWFVLYVYVPWPVHTVTYKHVCTHIQKYKQMHIKHKPAREWSESTYYSVSSTGFH